MRLPADSEITLARRLVLVVGLAYLAAQLLAFSLDWPPSWDEAIYLSQVAPGAEPLPFVPSRARGITFLALPILQLGGSLAQLRLSLAVASSSALIASFRMWVPVIGFGAVAAAVLFAGAWVAVQMGIAAGVEADVTDQRASARRAGVEVRRLVSGEPCQVYSERSFPIVGYSAGCRAARLGKVLEGWSRLSDRLEGDGVRVFLVLHRTKAVAPPRGTDLLAQVPSESELTWLIYGPS